MARRTTLVATAAALAALLPASAYAATAPATAPDLTSTVYAYPAILHWTPGVNPSAQTQGVYRKTGNCATTADPGGPIAVDLANTVNTYTARPVDGTWCYFIRATDDLGSADSPGLTVLVDTINPVVTIAVSGQSPTGTVRGTVNVTGTATDAVSGVAASVFHAGAVGACAAGPVISPAWDTTALANGAYDVCNVVTDNAGHVATAKLTMTVANPPPPAPPAPPAVTTPTAPVSIVGTVIGGSDTIAPGAPTKLSVVLPRAKIPAAKVRVTVRWVNPVVADLDRVVVILNQKRAPRGPGDGSRVYRGLRTSVALTLKAGQTAYVALFAYDRNGNVSPPARRKISLASLIPLRPITGSVVKEPPLLTWKGTIGAEYYNVQIFRNGKRMIVGWPSHASYQVPLGALEPGNYVWFVWPAEKRDDGTPAFGDLIGRATFVYAE